LDDNLKTHPSTPSLIKRGGTEVGEFEDLNL
jgi:hypothetical protein